MNAFPTSTSATNHHNVSSGSTFTQHTHSAIRNVSFESDCLPVSFSEMEFLPWNNPNNIVTAEMENTMRMMKNTLLGVLSLIGLPANVINMAVFYKQGLKDRVNLCLFSLSLADGLTLANAILHHGEQLSIQFTTKERFGPISTFLTNQNLVVLTGCFPYISQVLSAIIAAERCLCVYHPLKIRTLLKTRTMLVIILFVYALIFGLFFIVSFRYRIGCMFDTVYGIEVVTAIEGEFYKAHRELIETLDNSVFGVGLPLAVATSVSVTTILTIVKLRQVMSWRSQSSSFSSSSSISQRELALTRILVGTSIFFIVCTSPITINHFVWIFFPEVKVGRRNQNFFLTGIWLGVSFSYVNATFNIVIYYIMGSHYRETFWGIFGRQKKKKMMTDTKPVVK